MDPASPRLLTTPEAAAYLGLAPATLEKWRIRGGGPAYRKVHNFFVRYAQDDLDEWIAAQPRYTSTAARKTARSTVTPMRKARKD